MDDHKMDRALQSLFWAMVWTILIFAAVGIFTTVWMVGLWIQ